MTEIEIKFRHHDTEALRGRVLRAGGNPLAAFFEDNIVYDDREGSLFSRKLLLRLRKSDRVSLTFKRPIEKAVFKVMEEIEVEVSDFDSMNGILLALGYNKAFRYQKRRALYALGRVAVNLDETPIGDFVEIEGEKADIESAARALDLNMEEGISKSYLELYREHCEERGTEPADMVFRDEGTA
jgi:adenylate cyclase, class 2